MDNPVPPQSHSAPQAPPQGPAQRERIHSFEQMKVWQEAHAMTLLVLQASASIPAQYRDSVGSLLEKSAIEIPKSIAEGFKRRGSRNKAHYYNIAQSSLESLRYLLILARDLKCELPYEDLSKRAEQISRMLEGLVRSIARPPEGGAGHGGRGGGPLRPGSAGARNPRRQEQRPRNDAPAPLGDDWDG